MRKILLFLTLLAVSFGCSCSAVPPIADDATIAEEVKQDLPPVVDTQVVATSVTNRLLLGFDKASNDGTMTLMDALDAALDATEEGLKLGKVWDRRIASNTQMTVGAAFQMARQTTTMALMTANMSNIVLYDQGTPNAGLWTKLASALSKMVQDSSDGGFVTIGEVVTWPLALGMLALTETGAADRVVGTVSGATAPTTIGSLYILAKTTTENTLKALRMWDVILWRTE